MSDETERPAKKKQQPSRSFREDHWEFLDLIGRDVEAGFEPSREFDPRIPEDDEASGLALMFERAKLDATAPGHWQSMLVAVVNAYGKNWTRTFKEWPEDREIQLVKDIIEQHAISGETNRLVLCEQIKSRKPDEWTASPGALNAKLQKLLEKWRGEPDNAPEVLSKFEAVFGPARPDSRRLK